MCTDFMLPKGTGKRISGRTMDFGITFPWGINVIPEGWDIKGFPTPHGEPKRHHWNVIVPNVGIGLHSAVVNWFDHGLGVLQTDALNTEGLSAGALWLPGSDYPGFEGLAEDTGMISALDICTWATTSFKDIAELRAELEAIRDGKPTPGSGKVLAFWNPLQFDHMLPDHVSNFLPLHFQFHDRHGNSLVLEFRNKKLEITDNSELGVMTNAPFLEWHWQNLSNYLGPTNVDPVARKVIGMEVKPNGHGGGMLGVSTCDLPPTRFARACLLLDFAQGDLEDAAFSAAQAYTYTLTGNVAVLRGEAVDESGKISDYTQWQIVRNHVPHKENRDQRNPPPNMIVKTFDSTGAWAVNFDDFKLGKGEEPQFVKLDAAVELPALTA